MLLRTLGRMALAAAARARAALRTMRKEQARPVVEDCASRVPEWRRKDLGEAIDALVRDGVETKVAVGMVMRTVAAEAPGLKRRGYEAMCWARVDEVAWLALEAERRQKLAEQEQPAAQEASGC